MKKIFVLLCLTAFLGVGCSSSGDQYLDPALVDADISTDPAEAAASVPVQLRAVITGIPETSEPRVDFELRLNNEITKASYVEAKKVEPFVYAAETTFNQSGKYAVYVHLYTDDSHVIKMKEIEVK